jgi:hypothetical protein
VALFLALVSALLAAMVLYWTTNNLLHPATSLAGRVRS